ncbi:MAG: YesL family protein [Clostridia bacterium]|nr:YesL family protein [Clostridia bacterium]
MGFFDRFYYGKAGKRDYSEMDMPKNRVSLFFLVLKDHFFDLIKINFLQLVFWLPFLIWTYINMVAIQTIDAQALLEMENGTQQLMSTMGSYLMMWLIGLIPCTAITGPSSAGAAYVMRNWARDQHAFLFSDFKDAFKSNWKQALPVSIITALVPVLAYTAVMYYGTLASSNTVMLLPLVLVLSATLMWVLMLPLLYPMMIGYELRFSALLRNALFMAVARLPQMLMARLITFIPIALLFMGIYIGNGVLILVMSLYYMLFGFAFSRLMYASVANSVFDKFLNPHIEGAPVGMGLRPHTEEDELLDDDDEEEEDDEV